MAWRRPAETSTYLTHLSKYVRLGAAAITDEAVRPTDSARLRFSVLRSCNTIATSPNVPVVMSQRSLFTVLFINFAAIIPSVYRNTCGAQFLWIFHTILLIFKTCYWLYNVKHGNSTSMLLLHNCVLFCFLNWFIIQTVYTRCTEISYKIVPANNFTTKVLINKWKRIVWLKIEVEITAVKNE